MQGRILLAAICLLSFLGAARSTVFGANQSLPLRVSAESRGFFVGGAVAVSPFRNETIYRDTLRREFNILVAENAFKWDALHPARTTFNFTDADALVNFAEANGMKVRGHTLVWHNQIPGWLTGGNFSRDEVIALLREHILTVVGRYRGRIWAWDVVNEAIDDSTGQLRTTSFWQQKIGPDYIKLAFEFAREADPGAILYYNDFSAEGLGVKSDGVFNLVRNLKNQGVPINGVGWQMHLINGFRIQSAHRTNARRLADLGLEISVTELDVRIALPTSTQELDQQAQAYRDIIDFCLSEPNCKALVMWGFTDKFSWIPGTFANMGDALIFDVNYQPKPSYFALKAGLDGVPNPPPAPAGLSAAAGNAQVVLTWNASAGATSYNVKRSTTSGGPFTTVASGLTATSFTNTSLTNGTTYFFVVSAVNANGESSNSSQVSAIPRAPSPPSSPTGLSATAGNAQVALTWNASSGATSYNVKRSTASGGPFTTVASGLTATSFTNTSLTNGTTYFFVVSAVNANGESANSSPVSAVPTQSSQAAATVTATVTPSSGPYFSELDVVVSHTTSLTALTITVTVQKTPGVAGSGQYSNYPGGALVLSRTESTTAIVYTYRLASGQTLAPASNRLVGSQFSGNGTAHPYTGDTFVVTYTTSAGVTQTVSGHF